MQVPHGAPRRRVGGVPATVGGGALPVARALVPDGDRGQTHDDDRGVERSSDFPENSRSRYDTESHFER